MIWACQHIRGSHLWFCTSYPHNEVCINHTNRSYTTKAHENHTSVFPLVLITCMVRKHSNALFQLIRVCTRMYHCSKQLFPRLTTEGISDAATSLLMSLTVAFYRFYRRVRLLVLCFVTSTKTLLALDFAGAAGGSAAAAARGLL